MLAKCFCLPVLGLWLVMDTLYLVRGEGGHIMGAVLVFGMAFRCMNCCGFCVSLLLQLACPITYVPLVCCVVHAHQILVTWSDGSHFIILVGKSYVI